MLTKAQFNSQRFRMRNRGSPIPQDVTFTPGAVRSNYLPSRARTETYAGLLLLLLGVTVLTYSRCPYEAKLVADRPQSLPLRTGVGSVPEGVVYGSALEDGKHGHGWWIGHFIKDQSLRHSVDIEAKWAVHEAGKRHGNFAANTVASSMAVLVTGRHRMEFQNSYVVLEKPGDYVVWGPGVLHSWTALEDSTILCIRWPSKPDDQIHVSSVNSTEKARKAVQKLEKSSYGNTNGTVSSNAR